MLLQLAAVLAMFGADPQLPSGVKDTPKIRAAAAGAATGPKMHLTHGRYLSLSVENYTGDVDWHVEGDGVIHKPYGPGVVVGGWEEGAASPGFSEMSTKQKLYVLGALKKDETRSEVTIFALGTRKEQENGTDKGKTTAFVITKIIIVVTADPATPVNPKTPVTPNTPETPATPGMDKDLLASLRKAADSDALQGDDVKANAAKLATVYEKGAGKLADSNNLPRTWKDLVDDLGRESNAVRVATLPALSATRKVLDDYVGQRSGTVEMTTKLAEELKTKFMTMSAALKEIAK